MKKTDINTIALNKGNIISELRREIGYTQRELARALNVTDKAVSKWERGICLPDISLLPKLSRILGADIELLLAKDTAECAGNWIGFLNLQQDFFDASQIIYDKPAVYYMLSFYLLLDITDIYVRTTHKNKDYLQSEIFSELGFNFTFEFTDLPQDGLMIMNKPCFLFGSDVTRLFQGVMLSNAITKVNPINSPIPFLFCPSEYAFMYMKNPEYLYEIANSRNFGRGMVCIEMGSPDSDSDIASFVRMYQNNTGLLIGSLEEIAYRKGIIGLEDMKKMIFRKPYEMKLLKSLRVE